MASTVQNSPGGDGVPSTYLLRGPESTINSPYHWWFHGPSTIPSNTSSTAVEAFPKKEEDRSPRIKVCYQIRTLSDPTISPLPRSFLLIWKEE